MTSTEMRQKVAKLIQQGREVIELAEKEERAVTAEDRQQIDKIHAEVKELRQQIETMEAQESLERELREPDPRDGLGNCAGTAVTQRSLDEPVGSNGRSRGETPEQIEQQRELAFSGFFLQQADLDSLVTQDHRRAMDRLGLRADRDKVQFRLPTFYAPPQHGADRLEQILNALSVGSDTAGGFTVPRGFVRSLEQALLAYGGMRRVSTVLRTATGEALPYPTTDDTSNEGIEAAENAAISTTGTDVAFGSIEFRAYEYTSKFVRVSNQLIRDSAFNIGALLGSLLGERLGRIMNRRCTTGDGASKAKGIVTAATSGKTAASSTALDADEIIELLHSVDPAYREQAGAGWMMHDNVMLQVSLLKDGDGQYLLRPGLEQGTPMTLRGYPVTINQHMSSTITSGDKVMLFGLLSKYLIREVGSIRLQRLVERFAEYNQTAWLGFMSFDGNLLDAGTHPVKYMEMA